MPQRLAHPRLLRGLAFTLAAMALAGLAHRAGGGAMPGLPLVGASAAALAMVAHALAGRQRSLAGIAALVIASQIALHLVWQGADGTSSGVIECVAHAAGSPGTGAAMTVFHVLAAAVLAILLQRGERWTFAAARAVAHRSRGRVRMPAARALTTGLRVSGSPPARSVPAWRRQLAGGRATCGPPAAV